MPYTGKVTTLPFYHASQVDLPTPTFGTSAALKTAMDSATIAIQNEINGLIDQLNSAIALQSGAESLGSAPISGVAGGLPSTAYAQLVDLRAQILSLVGGAIPAQTINLAMLAIDVQNRLNQIYSNEREVTNLKARMDAIDVLHSRVDNASFLLYDLNDGSNIGSNGKIDNTKTNSTGTIPISAGTIVVPVLATTGFTVGQEVTIFDDVSLERRLITAINAGVSLSFAAMTNSYKIKAMICRSSVVQDTVNHLLKFGGWSAGFITNTAVSVVAAAYDTSGGNGDKLTETANGWLIAIEVNGTTIQVQSSPDNGTTWAALCTITGAQVGAAIAWNGANNVTIFWNSTTVVYSNTFDVTTVTNTDQNANKVTVDTQTSIVNAISIKTGSDGMPQAVWASKNATYPNSNNIRYSKATTTAVTAWATPTQITTNNTAGTDVTSPCIVVTSDNYPHIVAWTSPTTAYAIKAWNWNGTTWTGTAGVSIYAGGTFGQTNPCVSVAPSGRIWCVWSGLDATDTTATNIRVSYSDDLGLTWSAMLKLTSGNVDSQGQPVITADRNNNSYVLCQGRDTAISATRYQIRRIIYNGSTWGSVVSLTSNLTQDATNPSSIENNTLDFSLLTPPTIYKDAQAVAVKFSGTSGTITPVLVEDVRYNINPPANVSSAVAWVDHDTDANYSIAGAISFQAGGGNEIFTSMTKTTAAMDGTHNEDQFMGSGTAAAKSTLRLTLTRNSTSLTKNIQTILGAVGV
jgi:hypothetical protein